MEKTFVMLKPSTVSRGQIGEVLTRLEHKGFKIAGLKLIQMSLQKAEQLYAVHKAKPFYKDLVTYITSGPIVVMVVEGEDAVKVMRKLVGATNAKEAEPGTIRGDFAMSNQKNVVHASDSVENAISEMNLFFSAEEVLSYKRADEDWVY